MKPYLSVLAAALLVASPSLADMIAASPGVTLTEAAQAKFNHDTRPDDRYIKPVPGNSGIPASLYSSAGMSADDGWTLEQVAAGKFDQEGIGQGALTNRSVEFDGRPRLRHEPRLFEARGGGEAQPRGGSRDELPRDRQRLSRLGALRHGATSSVHGSARPLRADPHLRSISVMTSQIIAMPPFTCSVCPVT